MGSSPITVTTTPSSAATPTMFTYALLRTEIDCRSLGTTNINTTSRDPHIGQRKRLSSRESGKPLPRVHTNVSMSSSAR